MDERFNRTRLRATAAAKPMLTLILVVLAACSDDNRVGSGNAPVSQFDGRWDAGCLQIPANDGDMPGYTVEMEMNRGNFESVIVEFSEDDCDAFSLPLPSIGSMQGKYVLGDSVITESGLMATNVEFVIEDAFSNVDVKTFGTLAEGEPWEGRSFNSVLYVNGNVLYLGAELVQRMADVSGNRLDLLTPLQLDVEDN